MSELHPKIESLIPQRPPTPQALRHRTPDKPDASEISRAKPRKYIILLLAPTSVAGKVEIATSVSKLLSCPLFRGDSLHESSAKAAAVGASRSEDGGRGRYQRMWMSKMTRTGLLFPEESRPAIEGFSGFGGGPSSTSTSRRGSGSSISSSSSFEVGSTAGSTASSMIDTGSQFMAPGNSLGINQYINRPVLPVSEEERRRTLNPALMVLTHPQLESWHRDAIRQATGDYGIGIIFVPLFRDEAEHEVEPYEMDQDELPVLKPLDANLVRSFTSFDALRAAQDVEKKNQPKYGKGKEGNLEEEMVLEVDVRGRVRNIIEEVTRGVRNVMSYPISE